VLVFDEIDAGVSGAVADAVGARLQRLAGAHQLLCVTHLPQVAAYANRHFRVSKRVTSGRTRAGIADLSGNQRVEELARMLGGKRPTAASRRHASELLQAAGRAPASLPRSEA
jgi:DNA repair protein RecN (Recombination protein N)